MKRLSRAVRLHLGCGSKKKIGSVGVDVNPNLAADVIHDLNVFPYPFRENQFTYIYAENIIEHLDDIVAVMEEIHRIGRHGGRVYITTGHFSSVDAFTDPTHKHFFTSRTFDYFIPGKALYQFDYSKAHFRLDSVWLGPRQTSNFFLNLLLKLINSHALLYERRFAFIFPVGVIFYTLTIIKR